MSDRSDNPQHRGGADATGAGRQATTQHLDTDALSAFLDGHLDADLHTAAAGHIAACPDCRRELAELRATVHLLHGLPQYRPRRSFVLGPEYAHPVRTNRLVRLLPLLPALRTLAIAIFLLLIGVGTADILTGIGQDADDSSNPAAVTDSGSLDETAADAGFAAEENGGAGGPDSRTVPSSQGAARSGDESSGDVDASTGDLDEAGGEGAALSGASGDAAFADTDQADTASGDAAAPAAPREQERVEAPSADDALLAEAPEPEADTGVATDADAMAEPAEPAAPAAMATDAVAGIGQETMTQAGAAEVSPRRAGAAADEGLSTWRIVEYALAIVLIAVTVLVVSLQRLAARARRIGLVR